MALSAQYKSYVADLFAPLGQVTVKSMFGGGGVYYKDTMFALISDETLFLTVDPSNKADFEAEGCGPFVYDGKGKPISMSYYELPDRLLDDTDELMQWRKPVSVLHSVPKSPKERKRSALNRMNRLFYSPVKLAGRFSRKA